MAKRVYLFSEGSKDDRELLGGKGANLCEMTTLGLPVPFGFIITTPTCREFFQSGNRLPNLLEQEYRVALDLVEKKMGARCVRAPIFGRGWLRVRVRLRTRA